MPTETAFNERELALRWNVSLKTLQRWRSEKRGPPYFKLVSKAVRYAVDDIVAYEQQQHRGMREDAPLPPLQPPVELRQAAEPTAPAEPEPRRYTLREAVALIAQYGSLAAAEAAGVEKHDDAQD
jgi:hypothetical protein